MLRRFKQSLFSAREAYIAIVVVFLIAMLGFFLVGRIYNDTLARGLIEAMLPPIGTLCFAVITSSSTVITLLIAVLGFAGRMDNEFDHTFYVRIWFIATLATISLIMSSLLLLLITIPITEADSLSTWYTIIYWQIVVVASSMVAILIGMIVSLYSTLFSLISLSSPSWEDTSKKDTIE